MNALCIFRVVLACLIVTFLVGAWLRASFGNLTTLAGLELPDVVHAHSHLGYYAVLFPLAWLAQKRAGARVPEGKLLVVYLVASLVAFLAFLRAGYSIDAIVASAVVGMVWIWAAWLEVRQVRTLTSWRGSVPVAIVIASICVPPIALLTRRDPGFAQLLVQGFLFVLLFGAVVPAALASRQARPVPWPLWLLGVVLAALGAGPMLDDPRPLVGLAVMAAVLVYVLVDRRLKMDLIERGLWFGLVPGFAYFALSGVPHDVAMAGLHYAILGPVLLTLIAPKPLWIRAPWAAMAVLMPMAILTPRFMGLWALNAQRSAALVGLVLIALTGLIILRARR